MTRIFISWAGGETPLVSGLSAPLAITDHDPSFSLDAFVPFAEAVFLRVDRARAGGQLDEVRRLLGDGLWQQFQLEGGTPALAALTIEGAQVMAAGQDGTWDTVLVRFTARRPGRRGGTLVEDWTFQRPVAAAAQPAEAAGQPAPPADAPAPADAGGEECPVCGAPLSLTDEGTCRYCGAAARGGLGGWRLVRTAPVQPQEPLVVGSRNLGSRAGCILAVVILAVALVPTVGALAITGVIVGFVHQTIGDLPGVGTLPAGGPARLSGQGSFSGAITGDTPGTVVFSGGVTGSCASRAKQFTGVSFTEIESSDGGRKVLLTRATLPAGVEGPGTYDLGTTALEVSANYALTPDQGGAQAQREAQVWRVRQGETRAVLVLRPDGSGTLTVSGLAPTLPQPAGSSLGQPLGFTESFSCS